MFPSINRSEKQAVVHVPTLASGPASPSRTVPAPDRQKSTPTTFDDLPEKVVRHIGGQIFQASIHDPRNDISSLACTPALQETLNDEIQASAVLGRIRSAHDFPELRGAMAEARALRPHYLNGCLIAAIGMAQRLGPIPEDFLAQIQALLPAAQGTEGGVDASHEAVLFALIEAFGPASTHATTPVALANVMALIGRDSPVSPRLEHAMTRWTINVLAHPVHGGHHGRPRETLMPSSPLALQARMARLIDFSERFQADFGQPTVDKMIGQMNEMNVAFSTGDPDQKSLFLTHSKSWLLWMRKSPDFERFYSLFFLFADPVQQMQLVQWRTSPLQPSEIVPFLAGRIGHVPGTTLLRVLARHASDDLSAEGRAARGSLIRSIVRASLKTPEWDDVVEAAISSENIRRLGLRPFLDACVTRSAPERRAALTLRMDLEQVGCGEYSHESSAGRASVSGRMDALLDTRNPLDPAAIETMVRMNVYWLDNRQKTQLMERIRQLPPEDSARCLVTVFSSFRSVRSIDQLPSVASMLDACRSLPPELRARPLAALLDMFRLPRFMEFEPLLHGARRLYDSLPVVWRPVFNRDRDEALQQSRELAPG